MKGWEAGGDPAETTAVTSVQPGPYCFHFSSGATIPNPAGPHVADRGTTPRYEG